MSERAGRLTSLGILAGFVLLAVLFYTWRAWGVQVLDCTPPDTASHNPAIMIQVSSNRTNGHLTEHHLPGCTFYDYTGG